MLAVLVFGLLFVSADAIVASWVDAVLPDISVDSVVLRVFIAVAVAGPTLAAAYLALNPPRVERSASRPRAAVAHRFEWLVPVLLVDAVFALFVAAQLSVLFGGHDYVQRTTGLTYAEYVHQGFGQLTVATLLTLLVVWAASHWAGDTPRGPALAARLARAAVRADPGRGRLRAVPDAPLPGGLRLHPAPAAGRRLRGLARPAGGRGRGRRARALGRLGAAVRAGHRRGRRCSAWPRSTRTPGSPSRTSTGTPTPAGSTGTTCATSPRTPYPCSTAARRRGRVRAAALLVPGRRLAGLEPRPQPGADAVDDGPEAMAGGPGDRTADAGDDLTTGPTARSRAATPLTGLSTAGPPRSPGRRACGS